MLPTTAASMRPASRLSRSSLSNGRPAKSWMWKTSSAMLLASVTTLASTIEAPDSDMAPAIWANSPGWSGA